MIQKKTWLLLICCLGVLFSACGGSTAAQPTPKEEQKRTVTYLGKEIQIPAKIDRTVAVGYSTLEDMVLLGIEPVGGPTYPNGPAEYLADHLKNMKSVGNRTETNYETVISLKPDLIVAHERTTPETIKKLQKIAPTVQFSKQAKWRENFTLLGDIFNKQAQVKQILAAYDTQVADAKAALQRSDKKELVVLTMKIRAGGISVFPPTFYINDILYNELGFKMTSDMARVKAQEKLPLERLAQINPDIMIVGFSPFENADKPQALEDLQKNPIWQGVKAVKNNRVLLNKVHPLIQGNTAYGQKAALDMIEKEIVNK
ncbi:iron complex transport system substrate-binding protein [Thermosporothrix hazakensis]|jgi:iron complex transport system substrate-binding protein|uniref:Iron complex transport system substrate-binding protein n=2 Tax=Thermosporothrix TaxID=768650 RepID=A0A326UBH9_THEHA|nr:iron-siderophore ABC transporter substrate-binding protein [Thermosporothrix hazakensis]PZW34450.1 iron complex transport system substrate-binding protein [Thermosporothrix hazakensis]BBH85573.1 iron-uptake system-binding protein [Thermosporothrix sp. COM3]GCE46000.1 iron-uptake system-binding protein [Thermosporothrix hazakensis]